MSGTKDLNEILKNLETDLSPEPFVFITQKDYHPELVLSSLMHFKENEGITHIIAKNIADELYFNYTVVFALITLKIHSSLEAVGLTAAFSSALSNEGISSNVVAGFYHDHIFVPWEKREEAVKVIEGLRLNS